MKPTTKSLTDPGMLEYIEDIVGTRRYAAPIAKLQHRIRLLEIRGSRHAAQKRRGEEQMETFRAPMRNVLKYINESNELFYWQCVKNKNKLIKLATVKQLALQSLEDGQAVLAEKDEKKKVAQKAFSKNEARLAKLTDELMGLKDEDRTSRQKLRELLLAIEQRDLDGKSALSALVKATSARVEAEKAVKDAMEAPAEMMKTIEGLRQEVKQLMAQKEASEKMANDNFPRYEEKSMAEMAMRDQHAGDFAARNAVCNQIKTELTVVESELKDMKVTARQDEKRLDELKQALRDNSRKEAEGTAEIQRLTAELKVHEEQLKTLNAELPDLKTNEVDLCQRKAKFKAELDEQNAEISNVEYRNPSTAKFHELKAQGGFDKFLGRLGDLGSVEKKYDAPLSTIFGQLDYHIVEDEEAQMFAMNWAYANGLTRTTFFHFGLISESDIEGINASPNQFPAPRLFDKIRCNDERVRKVFYYVVKDLLVVTTLEEATRLDKKFGGKYRVCSLDGSLIERSGNMTGGGRPITNRIRTGAAPPIVTSRQMKKKEHLQSQYNNIVTKLDQIRERIRSNESGAHKLRATMTALGARINELKFHAPRLRSTVLSLEESIRAKEQRLRSQDIVEITVQDIEAKNRLRDELKQKLADHTRDAEEVKAKLDEFDAKLEKMFQGMVGVHRDQARKYKESAEILELDIAAKQRLVDNAPNVLKAAQDALQERMSEHFEKENEVHGPTPEDLEKEAKTRLEMIRHIDEVGVSRRSLCSFN